MFGLLIIIHEAGHFTAAKLSGVKVNEFSLGMGPTLLHIRRGETRYSLRLFPIGGFVSMEGENEDSPDERSFQKAKLWKRMIIVCAGAFMNIVLGFILAAVYVLASPALGSTVVSGFASGAQSSASGLQTGDRIVAINGSRVHISTDITYDLMVVEKNTANLTVVRGGKTIRLANVKFPSLTSEGITALVPDFTILPEAKNPLTVLKHSYYWTLGTVRIVWVTLYELFKGHYSVSDLSGPVGVASSMGQAAALGPMTLLYIVILITVNLGVVNLLPLPALDGGRMVFLLLEAVRRKPVSQEVEGNIHFAGFVLLMALVVFVTYNDLARLNVFTALGKLFR